MAVVNINPTRDLGESECHHPRMPAAGVLEPPLGSPFTFSADILL